MVGQSACRTPTVVLNDRICGLSVTLAYMSWKALLESIARQTNPKNVVIGAYIFKLLAGSPLPIKMPDGNLLYPNTS